MRLLRQLLWSSVTGMYQYSQAMILINGELRETAVGKEWLGILARRIAWMVGDETMLMVAMFENLALSCTLPRDDCEALCSDAG